MEDVSLEVLKLYGPLAIGWLVAAFLGWRVFAERKAPAENVVKAYADILEAYREDAKEQRDVLMEVTGALQKLSTLIEERTRRQSR